MLTPSAKALLALAPTPLGHDFYPESPFLIFQAHCRYVICGIVPISTTRPRKTLLDLRWAMFVKMHPAIFPWGLIIRSGLYGGHVTWEQPSRLVEAVPDEKDLGLLMDGLKLARIASLCPLASPRLQPSGLD